MQRVSLHELSRRLARHEQQLRGLADEAAALREALGEALRTEQPPRTTPRATLRSRVVECLGEVGVALPTDVLAYYDYARSDLDDQERSARFGTLRADEIRAFGRNSPRPVWLACGLTPAGRPVKRIWVLSTWDLADRIVTPLTERRACLRAALALGEFAEPPESGDPSPPFEMIAAGCLTAQAGLASRAGWAEVDATLTRLDAEDRPLREAAAERLRRLPTAAQLFGLAEDRAPRGTPAKAPRPRVARTPRKEPR